MLANVRPRPRSVESQFGVIRSSIRHWAGRPARRKSYRRTFSFAVAFFAAAVVTGWALAAVFSAAVFLAAVFLAAAFFAGFLVSMMLVHPYGSAARAC
jgi:fatty acid desaturase